MRLSMDIGYYAIMGLTIRYPNSLHTIFLLILIIFFSQTFLICMNTFEMMDFFWSAVSRKNTASATIFCRSSSLMLNDLNNSWEVAAAVG